MKQQNDIIVSGHAEQAEGWRGMWETQLAEIESAIRSGQTADALGVALVAVKSYPEGLGKCGMGCAAAREQRECRRAESVLEQLFRRSLVVIRTAAAARRLDVAAVDAGAIALREAYAPNPCGDGTASGTDYPTTGLWPECMTGAELARLTETTRRDLLSFRDTLARLNTAQPEEARANDPLPGWKLNKLVLKETPNGKKPGVFKYGRIAFTVPVGNAWDTVCDLIRADAFDGHGVKMKTPNAHFKREHRSFFTERLAKNESGWFIKTL